ncbi:hypothetical protein ACEPAF_3188 [Sanghuangporus sanghuang]
MSRSPVIKKSKKPFLKFDVNAFERDLVDGEEGLSRALEYLRTTVFSGGASDVLSALLTTESRSKLFEFTFFLADEGTAFLLREDLLAGFDLAAPDTSSASFVALNRLAGLITFLPYPPDHPPPPSLTEDFQFIQSAQQVIAILGDSGLLRQEHVAVHQDGETSPKVTKRKMSVSQKHAKQQARRRKDTLNIDEKPFRALNESAPSSQEEAQELTLRLFEKEKELLNRFIDLLRNPVLSEAIQEQCIPSEDAISSPDPTKSAGTEGGTITEGQSVPSMSSAYPRVQPVKASLFFESAEGLGEWRIFMSTTAIKDMRNLRRDKKVFKVILKKIKELSTGFFSDDNQKRLKGHDKGVPIFEAKLTGDLRLLYQIDIVSDFERNCESQGIRVYGIFTHAQMDNRMWASLSAQLETKGSEYRRRIEYRKKPQTIGDNVYLPQSWPDVSTVDSLADSTNSFVDANDQELVHQWLVLEKYSAFSKELLNCILHDKDSSAVFSVSPYEREVIEHPSSCYVLGRSGTGKTTTMTFKIFGIERSAQAHSSELDAKPRQLFVTQSRVLADKVKEFYAKFADFLSAASGESSSLKNAQSQAEPEGLVATDDDDDWRDNLPKRFSELQDQHFPLFLTYDKLCKLVEADLGISFDRPKVATDRRVFRRYGIGNAGADGDMQDDEEMQGSFVDFERFCNEYWPRFPEDLAKRLDPALVFSEFIGIIKGSQESLEAPDGYLSRETYLDLSKRTRSTFANDRDRIYRLFERYLALKKQYRDYDTADRSHAIIRKIKEGYDLSVDYLYVDEAQDNLIIDAFFLRRLCRNPHGLFWAGDTAQTISIGSSFRFNDLKASLYDYERVQRQLYPLASEKVVVQPAFFQLTTNYRSHGGIVNCASLIIELITHFWPHSIDALQRERGVVDGLKPVFFTGRKDLYRQFLSGEDGSSIEFGARQCILVRNNRVKDELRVQVGEIGNVLTLYESKGLEFDDVLLYNFFEDSSCVASQWRVILNFLAIDEESSIAVPRFDDLRHAGICTELKFLYVAITRARKNLWIIDRSDKGEPMKFLLRQKDKVELWDSERAPKLAAASTEAEWAEQGKEFFKKMQYREAIRCFKRAKLVFESKIAEAYDLRHEARNIPRSRTQEARIDAFNKAAYAFRSCGENSPNQRIQRAYFRNAAECFADANDIYQAASLYEKAGEYTIAAKCYAKAIKFDDAIRVIKTTNSVDPGTTETIIGSSRLHYIHVERLDKAVETFDSHENALEFLEDFGLDVARAMVLEKFGRIHEAADLLFTEGQSEKAVRLLLEDTQSHDSLRRAVDYLLTGLWNRYPFGGGVRQQDVGSRNPLQLVQEIDRTNLSEEVIAEVNMFDAISRCEKGYLLNTYKKFRCRNNPQAALLILDFLLTLDYDANDMQELEAVQYLEACLAYADILRDAWNHPISTSNRRNQRLFGFRKQSEHEFILLNGSFSTSYLHSNESWSGILRTSEAGIIVNDSELSTVIKDSITARLSNVVQSQVKISESLRNKFFKELCLTAVLQQGKCNLIDCRRRHIDLRSVDMGWFNLRLRFQLLQIVFLQVADATLKDSDRKRLQREWLSSLFGALNPPIMALGSATNLLADQIPEFNRGMNALAVWIENRAYNIDPNYASSRWFLDAVMEIATLAFLHDGPRARRILYRARFCTGEGLISMNGQAFEQSRIQDLLKCLDLINTDLIKSGSMFMRHVICYRLKIHVENLCRLVELLSASSVLLWKMKDNFHDCLLPKSWISHLISRLKFDQVYNAEAAARDLVECSAYLALHLLDSIEHENGSHLYASAYIVRCLAIQRICRAISLVGYNTTRDFRDLIVNIVVRLRAASSNPPHNLLKPYLWSNSWLGVRRAAERSVPPSNLDEMIHLVQIGRQPMSLASDVKIRKLYFKDRDTLVSLVSTIRKERLSKLSADGPVFVPRAVPSSNPPVPNDASQAAQADAETSLANDDEDEATKDHREQDNHDDFLSQPAEAEVSTELPAPPVVNSLTNEEKAAGRVIVRFFRTLRYRKEVRIIQRWYRAVRARRRELESPGLCGRRARYHKDCLKVDLERGKQWPSHHHRVVFLGVVPDLLVCLDALQMQLQSNKSNANKQLASRSSDVQISYDNYEKLLEQLNQASADRKRLEQLKENIKARSEWHIKRTLGELQNVVRDIASFLVSAKVGRAERNIGREVEELILKKMPTQPEKRTKPSLNVDDEY